MAPGGEVALGVDQVHTNQQSNEGYHLADNQEKTPCRYHIKYTHGEQVYTLNVYIYRE